MTTPSFYLVRDAVDHIRCTLVPHSQCELYQLGRIYINLGHVSVR